MHIVNYLRLIKNHQLEKLHPYANLSWFTKFPIVLLQGWALCALEAEPQKNFNPKRIQMMWQYNTVK
jgi:hypothetical protein